MNRRLAAPDNSLNATVRAIARANGRTGWWTRRRTRRSRLAESEELSKRQKLLTSAMSGLNERERHILTERRLKDEPATLEDLSKEYDISRERVRQIEVRAFEKLQKSIRNAAREQGLAG